MRHHGAMAGHVLSRGELAKPTVTADKVPTSRRRGHRAQLARLGAVALDTGGGTGISRAQPVSGRLAAGPELRRGRVRHPGSSARRVEKGRLRVGFSRRGRSPEGLGGNLVPHVVDPASRGRRAPGSPVRPDGAERRRCEPGRAGPGRARRPGAVDLQRAGSRLPGEHDRHPGSVDVAQAGGNGPPAREPCRRQRSSQPGGVVGPVHEGGRTAPLPGQLHRRPLVRRRLQDRSRRRPVEVVPGERAPALQPARLAHRVRPHRFRSRRLGLSHRRPAGGIRHRFGANVGRSRLRAALRLVRPSRAGLRPELGALRRPAPGPRPPAWLSRA